MIWYVFLCRYGFFSLQNRHTFLLFHHVTWPILSAIIAIFQNLPLVTLSWTTVFCANFIMQWTMFSLFLCLFSPFLLSIPLHHPLHFFILSIFVFFQSNENHIFLRQINVKEGKLLCQESGREYIITNGIPNMLLFDYELPPTVLPEKEQWTKRFTENRNVFADLFVFK